MKNKRRKVTSYSNAKTRNIRDESMLRRRNSTKSTKRHIKLTPEQQVYMGSISSKGMERQYLMDYTYALLKGYRRPISFDYVGNVFDEYDYQQYSYEINKAKYFADPKNHWKLLHIATKVTEGYFGCDVTRNYGVSHSYKQSDIPHDDPSKKCEEFLFPYGPEYYQAMINAPKIPIGPWVTAVDNRDCCIKTRKFLMNIDGDILIGEITSQKEKSHDNITEGAGSDIKICVYFKGQENGKFILDRWDYEPLASHPNKRDKNGEVSLDGYIPKKTRHSHRHLGTLENRLFATQGQSPDVVPTPINESTPEDAEEICYDSFEHMLQVFEQTLHIEQDQIPQKELNKEKSIKKLGKKFCPCYSQEEGRVVSTEDIILPEETTSASLPSVYDYEFPADLQAQVNAVKNLQVAPVVQPVQDDSAEVSQQQTPAKNKTNPLEQGGQ